MKKALKEIIKQQLDIISAQLQNPKLTLEQKREISKRIDDLLDVLNKL